jgi:hypothetical protein
MACEGHCIGLLVTKEHGSPPATLSVSQALKVHHTYSRCVGFFSVSVPVAQKTPRDAPRWPDWDSVWEWLWSHDGESVGLYDVPPPHEHLDLPCYRMFQPVISRRLGVQWIRSERGDFRADSMGISVGKRITIECTKKGLMTLEPRQTVGADVGPRGASRDGCFLTVLIGPWF